MNEIFYLFIFVLSLQNPGISLGGLFVFNIYSFVCASSQLRRVESLRSQPPGMPHMWALFLATCGVLFSFFQLQMQTPGLPWWLRLSSVRLQCRRPRFDPWVEKVPQRRKWQPTPVLLPGKSQGWRGLVGCSPWGLKESDTTERLHFTSLHANSQLWHVGSSSPTRDWNLVSLAT